MQLRMRELNEWYELMADTFNMEGEMMIWGKGREGGEKAKREKPKHKPVMFGKRQLWEWNLGLY